MKTADLPHTTRERFCVGIECLGHAVWRSNQNRLSQIAASQSATYLQILADIRTAQLTLHHGVPLGPRGMLVKQAHSHVSSVSQACWSSRKRTACILPLCRPVQKSLLDRACTRPCLPTRHSLVCTRTPGWMTVLRSCDGTLCQAGRHLW